MENIGKKDKRKENALIVLAVIICLTSIFLIYNLIDMSKTLGKKEYYSQVIVGDRYGFDLNGTALMFGMIISGGGSSSRELVIENNFDTDVRINIISTGRISRFLTTSKNNFILKVGEEEKVGFSVSVPKNTPKGTYNGKITIITKKA